MDRKEFVEVIFVFSPHGFVIDEIIWRKTTHYLVERLIHVCTCVDEGKEVLRHTVLIGGKQKYLYQDDDKWYIKVAA